MPTLIRRLVLLVALPLALGGCDLLTYAMYPDLIYPDPLEPDFGEFEEMSNYGQGAATIEIGGPNGEQTVTLNEVSSGSTFDGYGGAMVTWRNDDGWTVDLFAYGAPMYEGASASSGDITIRWIHESEIWTAGSYSLTVMGRCDVLLSQVSAEGLTGQATCHDLEWVDGTDQYAYPPTTIAGEEPFDVTITFHAQPSPPASY